jgi:pimeloyl-ACP methyl ester carboxylesterase
MEQHTMLARWTVYPEAGHFAPVDHPDLVFADIHAFCEGIEAAQ